MKKEEEFSFKSIFFPFTVFKAVHIIIFVGILVFANMLLNYFVWDDKAFILNNVELHKFNLEVLFKSSYLNNVNAGRYLPMTGLYFMTLFKMFSDVSFFYHIFQLIIHIVNTIFIFYIFNKFIRKEISFFLSLIFLIHPIQVESVSYIASSNNPLFLIFGLSAFIITLWDKFNWKRLLSVSILLLLSVFTKETGILFFLVIIFYKLFFNKKNINLYFASLGIVLAIYFYLRIFVGGIYSSKITLAPITRLDFVDRFLNIPATFFYYIKTLLFPLNLAVEQMWIVEKIGIFNFYLPLIFILLFFVLIIFFTRRLYQKNKKTAFTFLFFVLWFFVGIGLHLNLIALEMTVADRWFYFPFVGLLGAIGVAYNFYYEKIRKYNKPVLIFAIILVLAFSFRTIIRNMDWRDAISLYSHDTKIENNFDLENNLGGELNIIGKSEEAFLHFKKSADLFPHETNLFNVGLYYKNKNDIEKANYYFEKAYNSKGYGEIIEPFRHTSVLYENYLEILINRDLNKTSAVLEKALADYPNNAQLWYYKAILNLKLKDKEKALDSARKAYELLPNNINTQNLYNALLNGREVKLN